MTSPRTRRSRICALTGLGLLALSGCASGPTPDTAVRCDPGSVEIDITNVGDRTARYTVSVRFERAGYVENEMFSSNDVAPGATVTLSELRPDEPQSCTVTDVDVFEQ